MRRQWTLRAFLSLIFLLSLPAYAANFNIQITGSKQGAFKTATGVGTAFSFSGNSPFDAASGMATGKTRYSPVIVSKNWDTATVQILQAMATSENLSQVTFTFYKVVNGANQVAYTVKLRNARVVAINQYVKQPSTDAEDVSFVYQSAELTMPGGVTVQVTPGA